MPDVVFSVDQAKSMRDQAVPGHNRWHPDIPPAVTVQPDSSIRVECREWTDSQIGNNDSANDVRDVDLDGAHMLSGPIAIEGAEPGDLLVVDILDLGPCQPPQEYGDAPGQGWGYTGIFSKINGGGFLTEQYPDAYKAIWDFQGQKATSRHIPGVSYTGITHPGLFGTAPSPELLARWNARERALIATDPDRVPALALPPLEAAVLGGKATGETLGGIARDGARTVPARENGGNHDIKNFTRGSRVFYPVHAPRCAVLRRRPALQPGRRRDHVLRRHRDGRLHRLPRRPDQGRHGDLRRVDQPDPDPGQRRAAVLGVRDVHRHLGGPRDRHEPLHRRDDRLPQRLPQRDRVPQEVRLHAARRPTCCSARRRSRVGSAAWWTSPTPAARSTSPPRSSTST